MKRSFSSLLFTLVACGGGAQASSCGVPVKISDVTAELCPDISTVVTVRWTTDLESVGYVSFGPGDDLSMNTVLESTPATEHEAVLLGIPTETLASYQVVVAADDGSVITSDVEEITTGLPPTGLPELTLTGGGHDSYQVLPVIGGSTGPVIIDGEGRYLWWSFDDSGLDVYRARLSVDGQSLLYNAASVSGDPSDESMLIRVSLCGSEVTPIEVPLLAHDFVEHPDGTLGAMVVEYRGEGDDEIKGDQIIEIAPDGTQTQVWSAWDCFDPEVHIGDDQEYGWTFANALDYDPVEQAYYLSLRNFSSIVRIDRATASCDWVFGNVAATIEPAAGSASFLHEHQFELLDGSFLVFDNDGSTAMESRVLEYEFDPAEPTAEQIWEYVSDPSVFSFVLGDVHRLDDGDTLVTWSVNGQLERVTPEGESTWRLQTGLGYAFGFNTVLEDLYVAR